MNKLIIILLLIIIVIIPGCHSTTVNIENADVETTVNITINLNVCTDVQPHNNLEKVTLTPKGRIEIEMKFRKKPVIIDAEPFTLENKDIAFNFITCNCCARFDENDNPTLVIQTLEGDMTAVLGDWIIKGVEGEFYPCKPEIFKKTHEKVCAESQPRKDSE